MTKFHYSYRPLQLNHRDSRDIQRELWSFLISARVCATTTDEVVREILEHDLENRRIGFRKFFSRPITKIVSTLDTADKKQQERLIKIYSEMGADDQ